MEPSLEKSRKISADKPFKKSNDWPAEGRNFIFAIGIDTYKHLPPLSNAVRDAREVISVLTEKYQFEQIYVRTLFNQEATERNIRRIFDQLVDEVGPKDNLLIYFSGHGLYHEKRKRGYWIPVDAEVGQTADYLDNSIIKDYIQDIPSHHTFLVSDACYSGSFFRQSRTIQQPTAQSSFHYQKIYREPSRWALTSGGLEEVLDGAAGENSPFNQSFIHCLKYNTDPQFSVLELIMRVQKAVGNNTHQQPIGNRIYGVNDFGMGQFVFRLKNAVLPPLGSSQNLPSTLPPPDIPAAVPSAIITPVTSKSRATNADKYQEGKNLVISAIRALMSRNEQAATVRLGKYLHPSLKISSPTANRFWQHDFPMAVKHATQYQMPLDWGDIRQSNKKGLRTKNDFDDGEEWIFTINKHKGASGMPGFVRIFFSHKNQQMSVSGISI